MDSCAAGTSSGKKWGLIDGLLDSEDESLEQPYNLTSNAVTNRLTRVRMIVGALNKQLKEMSDKIKDITESKSKNKSKTEVEHASKVETNFQLEYAQAVLDIEVAKKKQEEVLLERQIAQREGDLDALSQKGLKERYRALNRRYVSAGGDLWRSSNQKLRLENPNAIISMQLDSEQSHASGIPELLMLLYKTSDGLDNRKKPTDWISDVIEYYSANPEYHGKSRYGPTEWCHVCGLWYHSVPEAVRIIPFLMDANKMEESIFGSESESLLRPANALLLQPCVQGTLEQYKMVIVPVDRSETPIKRWRVDYIMPGLEDCAVGYDEKGELIYFKDIVGKELSFLGERRPAPRFLYFHFVMALIRAKDFGCDNWQQIWARYYEQRPFPSPGNYMRKSMIRALATYFQVADMNVVESWISDQGFDTQLQIRDDQANELARRVHRIIDVDVTNEDWEKDEWLWDNYDDTDDKE